MKIILDDLNRFYSDRVRLIKTLMKRDLKTEHPEEFKWKLQMLYFDKDNWIEICRIDNYLHENQSGSHIHIYMKKDVKRVELTFQDAEKMIINVSKRILQDRFNETLEE